MRTASGDVGVHMGGEAYVLRPSLSAISSIGSPEKIVEVYASVMGASSSPAQIEDAREVLFACAGDGVEAAMQAFGHFVDDGGALRKVPGLAHEEDMLTLARHLLFHGVIGTKEAPKGSGEGAYKPGFHAIDMVGLAVAHLGLSVEAAWAMTMTELVAALAAKFPPEGGGKNAPSKEEADATEAWFDKIASVRDGS